MPPGATVVVFTVTAGTPVETLMAALVARSVFAAE